MKLTREYESRAVGRDDIDAEIYREYETTIQQNGPTEEDNLDDVLDGEQLQDEDNLDDVISDDLPSEEENLDDVIGEQPPVETDTMKTTFINFLKTLADVIDTTISKVGGEETSVTDGAGAGDGDEQVFNSKEDLLKAVSSQEEEERQPNTDDDNLDDALGDDQGQSMEGDMEQMPEDDNGNPDEMDDGPSFDDKPPVDEFQIEDDPDRQGNVHYVKAAHLVYRREQEDGTFEELWIYNIGDEAERKAEEIIRDILAGTDIEDNQIASDDGSQEYTLWTMGNAQMLKVTGLMS